MPPRAKISEGIKDDPESGAIGSLHFGNMNTDKIWILSILIHHNNIVAARVQAAQQVHELAIRKRVANDEDNLAVQLWRASEHAAWDVGSIRGLQYGMPFLRR